MCHDNLRIESSAQRFFECLRIPGMEVFVAIIEGYSSTCRLTDVNNNVRCIWGQYLSPSDFFSVGRNYSIGAFPMAFSQVSIWSTYMILKGTYSISALLKELGIYRLYQWSQRTALCSYRCQSWTLDDHTRQRWGKKREITFRVSHIPFISLPSWQWQYRSTARNYYIAEKCYRDMWLDD